MNSAENMGKDKNLSSKEIVEVEVEVEDTSSGEVISHPFNPNEIEIETPPFTVGYLMDRIEHEEINMNSSFQREGNLWNEIQQSRLIESILLGLPLPAFYFDTSNQMWDIIDGLQRCCSIENFCIKKELKLKGLEFLGSKNGMPYLEGKGFDDLDRILQRMIITRPITINNLKKAEKNVRYILFKRLNTGGLVLTSPEIRNAIFQGAPADTVEKLAALEEFKKATDGRIPSKRMEDRDFVSRFIAFYLIEYTKYEPGLDDFINKSMGLLEKSSENDLNTMTEAFKKGLVLAQEVFRNDAFRKRVKADAYRRPINKAYFEVITIWFAKLSNEEAAELKTKNKINLLKKNLITLMRSDRYDRALSQGTGSKDSVNIRFSWFKKVLDKTLAGKKIKVNNDNEIEDSEL